MRSGVININDVPKAHCKDPAVEDYFVLFDQYDLRMSLKLNGMFTCFHARVTTERELHEC